MINKMMIDEPTLTSATQAVQVKEEEFHSDNDSRACPSHPRHESKEGQVTRSPGDGESIRSAANSTPSSIRVRDNKMEDVPMLSRPPTHGSGDGDGRFPFERGFVGRNSTDWSSEWPSRTTSRGSRSNGHQVESLQSLPLDIQHRPRSSALGVEVKRESSYTPAPISPEGRDQPAPKVWDSPPHPAVGMPLAIPAQTNRSPLQKQFTWRETSALSQAGPQPRSPFGSSAEYPYPSVPQYQQPESHYRTPSGSSSHTRHVSQAPSFMHRSPQTYHPYLAKMESGPSSLPDRLDPFDRGFSATREGMTSGMANGAPFGHPEYTSMAPSTSRKRLTGKSNTPAACSACKK
jgi:hypothetical protein